MNRLHNGDSIYFIERKIGGVSGTHVMEYFQLFLTMSCLMKELRK